MFTPSFLHITNLYIFTSLHTHQYLFMRALYIYIFFLSDIFISFPLSYISRYTPLRSRAIRRLVFLLPCTSGYPAACLFHSITKSWPQRKQWTLTWSCLHMDWAKGQNSTNHSRELPKRDVPPWCHTSWRRRSKPAGQIFGPDGRFRKYSLLLHFALLLSCKTWFVGSEGAWLWFCWLLAAAFAGSPPNAGRYTYEASITIWLPYWLWPGVSIWLFWSREKASTTQKNIMTVQRPKPHEIIEAIPKRTTLTCCIQKAHP